MRLPVPELLLLQVAFASIFSLTALGQGTSAAQHSPGKMQIDTQTHKEAEQLQWAAPHDYSEQSFQGANGEIVQNYMESLYKKHPPGIYGLGRDKPREILFGAEAQNFSLGEEKLAAEKNSIDGRISTKDVTLRGILSNSTARELFFPYLKGMPELNDAVDLPAAQKAQAEKVAEGKVGQEVLASLGTSFREVENSRFRIIRSGGYGIATYPDKQLAVRMLYFDERGMLLLASAVEPREILMNTVRFGLDPVELRTLAFQLRVQHIGVAADLDDIGKGGTGTVYDWREQENAESPYDFDTKQLIYRYSQRSYSGHP